MPRSGRSNAAILAILALLVLPSGCWYGFAGGGLPSYIRTVAVLPLDNQTASADVQPALTEALREGLEDRLNLRSAAEGRADAVLRGTIRRYETDIPIGLSADTRAPTASRRRLQLVVDLAIVDQATGNALWERTGLAADGEYGQGGEEEGLRQAIQEIVTLLIEGAQSQW